MPTVSPIAGEVLVSPVAGQGDHDPPARQLTDPVGRHRGAVRERLVVQLREAVDQIEIIRIHFLDVVIGPVPAGNLPRIPGFVEFRIAEGYRTGVHGLP